MSPSPRRRFWIITLAALAGLAVTARLGWWQLDRGRQRDAIHAAVEARANLPALSSLSLLSPQAPELVDRSIVLRGTWDEGRTVFLDNRQMRAVPGFYVFTPMKIEGSDRYVLVQRGWVPRNFERREQLPAVQTPPGTVEVAGRIALQPARLYEFRGTERGPIRQNLDIADYRAETGLPLLGVTVVQTAPRASEGLLRDWPQPGSGSDVNYGYAFQWWAMSAAIAILYAWFQFIAPRRKKPNAG